MLLIFAKQV